MTEYITVATALYNLAKPFLEKAGESVAEKAGEGVWSYIKGSLTSKKEKELVDKIETVEVLPVQEKTSLEADLINALVEKLKANPEFSKNSGVKIQQAEKIINIGTINGGATFNL